MSDVCLVHVIISAHNNDASSTTGCASLLPSEAFPSRYSRVVVPVEIYTSCEKDEKEKNDSVLQNLASTLRALADEHCAARGGGDVGSGTHTCKRIAAVVVETTIAADDVRVANDGAIVSLVAEGGPPSQPYTCTAAYTTTAYTTCELTTSLSTGSGSGSSAAVLPWARACAALTVVSQQLIFRTAGHASAKAAAAVCASDVFSVLVSPLFSTKAVLRQAAVDELGFRMVTDHGQHTALALQLRLVAFSEPKLVQTCTGGGQDAGFGGGVVATNNNNTNTTINGNSSGNGAAARVVWCPSCAKPLCEAGLWHHYPQFHTSERPQGVRAAFPCPLCPTPYPPSSSASSSPTPSPSSPSSSSSAFVSLAVFEAHLHEAHPPKGVAVQPHGRPLVQLYAFALVVVRRPKVDGKFLLVQERARRGWWLPGGGIDAGEDPLVGGVRETEEEAGVAVRIKGLLNVQVSPNQRSTRLWYIFYAEPADALHDDDSDAVNTNNDACAANNGAPTCADNDANCPKTAPDHESVGAVWASVEEVFGGSLRMRGHEPAQWFSYVAKGGQIHPLSLLTVI